MLRRNLGCIGLLQAHGKPHGSHLHPRKIPPQSPSGKFSFDNQEILNNL
jgi:hypothetical protein